jgi:hypothetical protein
MTLRSHLRKKDRFLKLANDSKPYRGPAHKMFRATRQRRRSMWAHEFPEQFLQNANNLMKPNEETGGALNML